MLGLHISGRKPSFTPKPECFNQAGGGREEKLRLATFDGKFTARVLVPHFVDRSLPPVIALHGISRNADAIYTAFAASAIDSGRILIVPRFSRKYWPVFQRPGCVRADQAILALIEMLCNSGTIQTESFELFGFSGGRS